MKALLLIAVCLLTACAQHTIDKDAAVQQSVDQQNRHFETMGVPRNHQPQPQVPFY